MGVHTRVYRINEDLAINIPTETLPEPTVQSVEEVTEIPGHLARTTSSYPVLVRPYKERTALLLTSSLAMSPFTALEKLGLDPYEQIWIRFPHRREWIPAHRYHGYYGRVWIPAPIAHELRIRSYDVYDVFIKGTTFPQKIIRIIRRPVRTVTIEHMEKQYPGEEYAPDRWRWRIPQETECYSVLDTAFAMRPPRYPLAECHRQGEVIYVDFLFYSEPARSVSEQAGYAYRTMAVRNYTAATDKEIGYPFLCEIRATYISSCLKDFYQRTERPVYTSGFEHMTLKDALEITVYNMLQHFFKPAKTRMKYSTMSYADHIGKIDFTTNMVFLPRRYSKLPDVPAVRASGETKGEGINYEAYPYYRAIKYIRIVNEQTYKSGRGPQIYDDAFITDYLKTQEENRMLNGMVPLVVVDESGFIWRA